MGILGDLTPEAFLREHWQHEPIVVRDAWPTGLTTLEAEELAGLACEPDVDARIVSHDQGPDEWYCQFGPFSASDFEQLDRAALPWTLLVRGVERLLPESGLSDLLDGVDFLPRWRLEDIMVSYAVEGGSVGPHFDYYDVFLVQLAGHRQWRIGERCGDESNLRDHPDLKLLAGFECAAMHDLGPGDLIYVPPGLAHWGVALDDQCLTASIGFRAPSHAEILREALEELARALPESSRFEDALRAPPARADRIAEGIEETTAALRDYLGSHDFEAAVGRALGRLVTENFGPDERLIQETSEDGGADRAQRGASVQKLADSRCAYLESGAAAATLFLDGDQYETTLDFAERFCAGEEIEPRTLSAVDRAVVAAMQEAGVLAES